MIFLNSKNNRLNLNNQLEMHMAMRGSFGRLKLSMDSFFSKESIRRIKLKSFDFHSFYTQINNFLFMASFIIQIYIHQIQ